MGIFCTWFIVTVTLFLRQFFQFSDLAIIISRNMAFFQFLSRQLVIIFSTFGGSAIIFTISILLSLSFFL